MIDWTKYPHFARHEFDSKGPGEEGTGDNMQVEFLDLLHKAREYARIPFIINSGYRTETHNRRIGGSPNSSHKKGWAADIKVGNSSDRYIILKALLRRNFRRIGVYETFIHVDCDPDKPQGVIWYK